MSSNNQPLATCADVHRMTARGLRLLFAEGSSFKDGRSAVARHLNVMARAAGINPVTFQIRERWKLYLKAARALRRAGKLDNSSDVRKVQTAVIESLRRIQQSESWARGRRQQGETTTTAATCTSHVGDNNRGYICFGLEPGDKLELTKLSPADLHVGDLIAMWDERKNKWGVVGRFIQTARERREKDDTAETEYVKLIRYDGEEWSYALRSFTPYLIETIHRTIKVPRGASTSAARLRREAQVSALRARLERLEHRGDLTNSTARFKLEKQIYDLEHGPDADEWPDIIGAEEEA